MADELARLNQGRLRGYEIGLPLEDLEAIDAAARPDRPTPAHRARRLARLLPQSMQSRETTARLGEVLQDNPDWDRWDVQRWGRQQAEDVAKDRAQPEKPAGE